MHEPDVLVKRYGSGRLYDTAAARYVNLDDIANLLRAGQQVKVRDAGTGADISAEVAAQALGRR